MQFEAAAILVLLFFALLALNVPIAVCIGMASVGAVLIMTPGEVAVFTAAQKMVASLDSFALLAVPFFILSGVMMNSGGIAHRLVNFAKAVAGGVPGSMSQTNVMGNVLFGCVSGSAIAASTAIGGTMIPFAVKDGYDRDVAAAANIASAPTGMLIPPTTSFIIYATVAGGASVSAMFVGGAIAGLLWGFGCMVVVGVVATQRGYPRLHMASLPVIWRSFVDALPSLLLILLIVGGITAGVFTAIEASAVAVLYTLVLTMAVYRSLNLRELHRAVLQTFLLTSAVMFLLAASAAMSFAMAFTGIPAAISSLILGITNDPFAVLLIINVLLLIVGMFFDIGPAILIFTPILLPLAVKVGVTPAHFGVIMVYNLCIGTITPPVGTGLFVGAGVGKVSVGEAVKALWPHYVVIIGILFLITYVPALTMGLPKLLGI
ncbi:MAG TPA: TRAP transporter large permease [Rhodocyclaceae bacterium]|nr:TRAP transporter large permease [Rhodocyclaceae bacterium]